MRFTLARDGEPQLAFDGERIVSASSAARGKKNWTELTLYVTDGGSFVVQTVARTLHADQRDWFSARAYDTAAGVVDGLRGKVDRRNPKAGRQLSGFALSFLEQAADIHDGISEALDAIEGQEEVIK